MPSTQPFTFNSPLVIRMFNLSNLYNYLFLTIHFLIFLIYLTLHFVHNSIEVTNSTSNLLQNATNDHQEMLPSQIRQYYCNLRMIVLIQFLLNLLSTLTFILSQTYRTNQFIHILKENGFYKVGETTVRSNLNCIWARLSLELIYLLIDLVPIVTICSTVWLVDFAFGGRFVEFGWNVVKWHLSESSNSEDGPITELFPITTNCTTPYFTQPSTLSQHSNVCILTHNHINQFVFLFWWFTYFSLLSLFSLNFVKKIVLDLTSSKLRLWHCNSILGLKKDPILKQISFSQFVMIVNIKEFVKNTEIASNMARMMSDGGKEDFVLVTLSK